jgi:hypothetical protein
MILKPKGHYCVVGWSYGSEVGRLEIDGINTKAQAKEFARYFLSKKYKLDPQRLRIKEVFIAGKGQSILSATDGTPGSEGPSSGGLLQSSGDRPKGKGSGNDTGAPPPGRTEKG